MGLGARLKGLQVGVGLCLEGEGTGKGCQGFRWGGQPVGGIGIGSGEKGGGLVGVAMSTLPRVTDIRKKPARKTQPGRGIPARRGSPAVRPEGWDRVSHRRASRWTQGPAIIRNVRCESRDERGVWLWVWFFGAGFGPGMVGRGGVHPKS